MKAPLALAFLCGFISLSCEVLWVRLVGFAEQSTPQAFGFVLFCFILGIALGAYIGKNICRRNLDYKKLWSLSSKILLATSALIIALPLLFSLSASIGLQLLSALILITCNALIISILFPIVHHLGAEKTIYKKGSAFSAIYFSNVMGASLGPLVCGYVFLDIFTTQQTFILLAAGTSISAILFAKIKLSKKLICIFIVCFIATLIMGWQPHWILKNLHTHDDAPIEVIETRQGIITIFLDAEKGDMVFGGNVYDGRTNLNGDINSNGINRILLTSVLQPSPKKVLMVGLSIGTWVAIVKEFPAVESIDVIEINPGYLQAISHYPIQKSAINDKRVQVHIDDARRWLKANPNNRYDLIIMNTTWSWRSYSTLLLSKNFMQQIKQHMAEEAIFSFNSTVSDDAFYTSTKVFNHAYKYKNFVYASDHDFRKRKDTNSALSQFQNFRINGEPIFKQHSQAPAEMLKLPFLSIENVQSTYDRKLEVITDQNMISEFKYGRKLFN